MSIDPYAGLLGGAMMIYVVMIVLIIVFYVVAIALAVWVYKDAQNRGMDNPALWLIIVLLVGCIGCIIYLIVRPKD